MNALLGLSALGSAVAGATAAAAVSMTTPAPLQKDVDAFPKIALPLSGAERQINATLARYDAAMPRTIHQCRTDPTGPVAADAYWTRVITVTMPGPRFLGFLIEDDASCGGAHPSTAFWALTYDLETGLPVDWTLLLPPALTGKVTMLEGMDGLKSVRLASKTLHKLYLAGYGATAQGANPDCREAVTDTPDEPPPASVWPDADKGGLAVQFDVAHVAEACALPVIVPLAKLKIQGASLDLISAIAAAHRAH